MTTDTDEMVIEEDDDDDNDETNRKETKTKTTSNIRSTLRPHSNVQLQSTLSEPKSAKDTTSLQRMPQVKSDSSRLKCDEDIVSGSLPLLPSASGDTSDGNTDSEGGSMKKCHETHVEKIVHQSGSLKTKAGELEQ
jgi:hypothetical protein